MGQKILLHIGYPKTGTTFLQKQFFPLIENSKLFNCIDLPKAIYESYSDTNKGKIQSYFYKNSYENIIISCEQLLGKASEDIFLTNAYKYHKFFPQAKILIVIRNQIDKFISNYSHYIKIGGTKKINDFLFPNNNSIFFGAKKHKYDLIVEQYKKVFQPENVLILLYEDLKNNSYLFLEKIKNNFELDIDFNKINFSSIPNIRLSKSLLNIKRISNKFTKHSKPMGHPSLQNKHIIHIPFWFKISEIVFERFNYVNINRKTIDIEKYMGSKTYNLIYNFYKDSNKNLIVKYGLNEIKKYNYPL